jgi:site-specific DNA recombinase
MTAKGGRYRYYTCQRKRTMDVDACGSKAMPMPLIDDLVISALESHILAPDRLAALLSGLLDRSDDAMATRRGEIGRLKAEKTKAEAALRSTWDMIDVGAAAATDADVAERMVKHRTRVKELGDEIRLIENQTAAPKRGVTPEAIERFAAMVREGLRGPDISLRKDYLHMLVETVEMRSDGLVIRGSKRTLEFAATTQKQSGEGVLTFARKWCARNDSNVRPSDS